MFFNQIKSLFRDALFHVASHISPYLVNPDKNFTRRRKLPPEMLISFLVSRGVSRTCNELDDFFDFRPDSPFLSALNQQRDKLRPQALEQAFRQLNRSLSTLEAPSNYRSLAVDSSSFSFFSRPQWASEDYFVSQGHSAKGFYSIHLNALYDLDSHTYKDALIQPVHCRDKFRAFCAMVDRLETPDGLSDIFIADRRYCSYNNMAHILEKNSFSCSAPNTWWCAGWPGACLFLRKGLSTYALTLSLSVPIPKKYTASGDYITFVDAASAFDFLPYGSMDTYTIPVRVVRFPLDGGSYECLMTNVPIDEFSMEDIKRLYFSRWGFETSFRKLKYTIGLSSFLSYKAEFIKQEIWAKLTAYNLTETIVSHTAVETRKDTKFSCKVNFTAAAHICRVFFRLNSRKSPADVLTLPIRKLIPVRNERSFPRLQTARFRRPKYFLYRAV